MTDIFDTSHEGKEIDIGEALIKEGDEVNLFEHDPTLSKIALAAGWDVNTFSGEEIDVDVSIFLLNRNQKTRNDNDFIFYNQPEALEGGIVHGGDSRVGFGDGDDETILIELQKVPFDVLQIPVVISIYKGFEKKQALDSMRRCYVRIINADTGHELFRFNLTDIFKEHKETGAIIGWINREGPKWHFKADLEYFSGGLGEIARSYDIIVNQE